jgi:NTP pyrophosphatase (non-canonical NTP hydrolase)
MKELNDLAKQIHQNAKDKGFWDSPRNTGELFMLIISEASEALEAHRKGRRADIEAFEKEVKARESIKHCIDFSFEDIFRDCIKDTTADEIADVVIRILDYCCVSEIEIKPALLSSDLVSFHSENFGAQLFQICGQIQRAGEHVINLGQDSNASYYIHSALALIIKLCEHEQIDLLKHIELKMKYNATRERMHGKAY